MKQSDKLLKIAARLERKYGQQAPITPPPAMNAQAPKEESQEQKNCFAVAYAQEYMNQAIELIITILSPSNGREKELLPQEKATKALLEHALVDLEGAIKQVRGKISRNLSGTERFNTPGNTQ